MTDYNGFGSSTPAGLAWQNDSGAYTFGQRFRVDSAGLYASKIRWFIPSGSPNAPTTGYYVALYEVGNATPVATAGPFSGVSIGAWNEKAITPTLLDNGGDYMAAVLYPGGYYGADTAVMDPGGTGYDPAGPINFYTGSRFHSGGTLTYPDDAFGTPWYGVDVTVTDSPAGSPETATLAIVLPTPVAALSGAVAQTAALAVTLPTPAVALAGAGAQTANLAVVLPGLQVSIDGQPQGTATLSIVLPKPVVSLQTVGGTPAASTKTAAARVLEALWFTEEVQVERVTGATGYGTEFATATTVPSMIDHGRKAVVSETGESILSTARVFCAIDVDEIPIGSRLTFPDSHGGDTVTVMSRAYHRTGLNTPDHLELTCG